MGGDSHRAEHERQLNARERLRAVLEAVGRDGHESVTSLSQEFLVSRVTVRSDLAILAAEGAVIRTHGGAVRRRSEEQVAVSARQGSARATQERGRNDG